MHFILTVVLLVLSFFSLLAPAGAAENTAYHRQIYTEVNRNLGQYTVDHGEVILENAPHPLQATTWREAGVLRKMVIEFPDDHGLTTEALYYDRSDLVFVFETVISEPIDGSAATRREARYYFTDGKMILWLDHAKKSIPAGSTDFLAEDHDIRQISALVLSSIQDKKDNKTSPLRRTRGLFAGIEQGDYFHLLLTVDGGEQSFFILQTDATLETLFADPEHYIGKEITVFWHTSTENIPEAGGPIEIDTALSVQLP
jgi:hypothetical protein